jgi:threonine/homoserine/homoserine lactone efflux protein
MPPLSPTFAAFLAVSFIVAVTPGPGVVYIVSRTLTQGRIAGFASVCGIAAGNLGNAAAASLGIAALFAASASAFALIKLGGAAYLIFLGVKALRSKSTPFVSERTAGVSKAALFRDGFVVALLNPKTMLFFAALLPQFMSSNTASIGETLSLSAVFVSIAIGTDTLYVLSASKLSAVVGRHLGWQRYGRLASAATFFGLGLYAVLASPRSVK